MCGNKKKTTKKPTLQTNLSICKYGGVVSFKAAFDQPLGAVLVDGFLLSVDVKDVVVGKGLVLAQDHLGLARHHEGADVAALDLLFGQLRTDPAEQRRQVRRKIVPNLGTYKQEIQNVNSRTAFSVDVKVALR